MTPSFLASLLMQSSDSPILLMAPQMAYVLKAPVIRPVDSSTSAMLIWLEKMRNYKKTLIIPDSCMKSKQTKYGGI